MDRDRALTILRELLAGERGDAADALAWAIVRLAPSPGEVEP